MFLERRRIPFDQGLFSRKSWPKEDTQFGLSRLKSTRGSNSIQRSSSKIEFASVLSVPIMDAWCNCRRSTAILSARYVALAEATRRNRADRARSRRPSWAGLGEPPCSSQDGSDRHRGSAGIAAQIAVLPCSSENLFSRKTACRRSCLRRRCSKKPAKSRRPTMVDFNFSEIAASRRQGDAQCRVDSNIASHNRARTSNTPNTLRLRIEADDATGGGALANSSAIPVLV